jgi:hypothetical protein
MNRKTQLIYIALAIRDKDIARQCRRALSTSPDFGVIDKGETDLADVADAEILIVCHDTMCRAAAKDPALPLQLMRRLWVIQALRREDLMSRGSPARHAHGWVFIDQELPRLADIIRMSGDGYCVVPAPIVNRLTKARAASPQSSHLALLERAALRQLMRGNSAAVAGRNLGLPKSAAMDLLRAVWIKCGWPTVMRPTRPLGRDLQID